MGLGVFTTQLTWPLARLVTPVEVLATDDRVLPSGTVALYEVPPPAAPVDEPPEVWRSRVALRVEGGVGLLLSAMPTDQAYDRQVRAGLRVGVPLARPWIVQASGVLSSLGSNTQSPVVGASALLGLRFEPRVSRRVRVVVDAAGGVAFGRDDALAELEAGAGVELRITRGFGIGPMLRYDRVFSSDAQQSLSAALSLSLTPWP